MRAVGWPHPRLTPPCLPQRGQRRRGCRPELSAPDGEWAPIAADWESATKRPGLMQVSAAIVWWAWRCTLSRGPACAGEEAGAEGSRAAARARVAYLTESNLSPHGVYCKLLGCAAAAAPSTACTDGLQLTRAAMTVVPSVPTQWEKIRRTLRVPDPQFFQARAAQTSARAPRPATCDARAWLRRRRRAGLKRPEGVLLHDKEVGYCQGTPFVVACSHACPRRRCTSSSS